MSERRVLPLAAGLLVALGAVSGPIEIGAAANLGLHMVQHVLLLTVAAPLLAFGVSWGRDASARVARTALVVGFAAQTIVMVGWHVPVVYDAANEHVPLHVFEHVTLLLGAGLFWWAVVHLPRPDLGFAVLALFASTLPCTAVGAGLALAPEPWYGAYPSLSQQQMAGVLMWIVPGALFTVAGAAAFAAWITAAER
ncbi:MAG TPA: cytochrome c oxidase assembly protein [Acidimicrobiia bacterium]|nr:cytochrome c oxidase assembly protein [Acidimicrobiia bacterium]